jgi:DnaJ like chaperone protein
LEVHRVSWWGLLLGGTFGFLLGGPIGALLGAAAGRLVGNVVGNLDLEGSDPGDGVERVQLVFFVAVFSVMGHVAKTDGRVSREEVRLANQVMDQLGLDASQREAARALFNAGRAPDFALDAVLAQFRGECGRALNLVRMFMEIQIQAATADGVVHGEEARVLLHIATQLGLSRADYLEIERLITAGVHAHAVRDAGMPLDDAYATLGVSPEAPEAEIKRHYRRLMSRHHPDKLASQGLPEEMMRAATERTQQIKAAWDAVRKARAGDRGRPPAA